MKKTLIAAGIAAAVAAPSAFAEVKIGGKVEQGFTKTDSSSAASDEWTGTSDVVLTFKASEDLGNGMSAFSNIRYDLDGTGNDNDSSGLTLTDYQVGLKGSFGTVVTGRMEDFSEAKALSMVDVFYNGDVSVELGGDNAGRNDDGIAYVSPSMNGFSVGVAAYIIDDTANDIENIDATDIALFYNNGPLSAVLSQETYKDDTGSDNEKITTLAAKYDMGDLSVRGVYQDLNNADNNTTYDHEDLMLAAVYKMGSNSVAVGWSKNELTTGATDDTKWAVEFRHHFSKRTTASIGYEDYNAATSSSDTEQLGVSIEHKF